MAAQRPFNPADRRGILITMSDAHSLLAAAWQTGDTTPLLALADLLDEQTDHDTAELIRLTAAAAVTARHSPDRTRRLKQLRDAAWKRARTTAWPDMAVQPDTSAAGFSRRPDPSSPARETIVVRPDRQTIHRLTAELDGGDEVIRSTERRSLAEGLPGCSAAPTGECSATARTGCGRPNPSRRLW